MIATNTDDHDCHGFYAYVLDTAIDTDDPNLDKISVEKEQGKVERAIDAVHECEKTEKGSHETNTLLHGTMVASLIAGRHGLASGATIVESKVVGDDGRGDLNGLILALGMVMEDIISRKLQGKAVVNISLSGDLEGLEVDVADSLTQALAKIAEAGTLCVVASGNDSRDASRAWPAASPSVCTVGALGSDNDEAGFSNHGNCVDVLAPGVEIPFLSSNRQQVTYCGTSFAAPLVSGLALRIMAANPGKILTPTNLKRLLVASAAKDIITLRPRTVNLRAQLDPLTVSNAI